MIALWILIGGVIVTVAFFLPGHSSELWPNINSAGTALFGYFVALLWRFWRRSDLSQKRRVVVLLLAVLAFGGTTLSWRQMKAQSYWQRDRLNDIGATITRGIYTSMVPDSLLTVLDAYHRQTGRLRTSLGEMYRAHFPPGDVGDAWSTMEATGRPDPVDDVFLTAISDTHVVLVARHPWFEGRDTSFVNAAGVTGMVQVRVTLTEKGIEYVTEN